VHTFAFADWPCPEADRHAEKEVTEAQQLVLVEVERREQAQRVLRRFGKEVLQKNFLRDVVFPVRFGTV
jgi:hypothetical protein